MQTVENVSEIFVSRLRNTATDIVGGKTGQKSADRNKLDFLVIYVDNNTAAKAVITVYERIKQCLAESFFGIVNLFDAFKTFERSGCFITEGKICESAIKLLKNRAAELLAITEFCICFVRKNSYLGGMRALIGNDKRQIAIHFFRLNGHSQCAILVRRKLYVVTVKCFLCAIERQLLLHRTHTLKVVAVGFLNHCSDLLGRSRNRGGALTNKNATRLQSFGFQIIRLEGTLTNFNTNRVILLKCIFYKHCNVG